MANKVTIIRSFKADHGGIRHRVLYFYVLSPAIADGASPPHTILPSPASMLTADALRQVSDPDKTSLNTGAAGFEEFEFYQTVGETQAAFLARLLTDHAARQTWWVRTKKDEFQEAGKGTT